MDRLRFAKGIPELADVPYIPYEKVNVPKPDVSDPFYVLCAKIFARDPDTHLPSGDIAVFMSDNTSPEVKAFISQNLMRENNVPADASGHEGLDDDTIAQLTRGRDESEVSYVTRAYNYIKSLRPQNREEA